MGARTALIRFALIAVALVAGVDVCAQPGLGAVRDSVELRGPAWQLRHPVVPGSVAFWLRRDSVSVRLDSLDYRIDYPTGAVLLRQFAPSDSGAVLIAHYRVLDLGLREVYARRRIAEDEPDTTGMIRLIEIPTEGEQSATPLFGNSQLTRRGSITRGVIAGNNRDVSLESGLRMELSGPITDDVSVQAVLTDENTPIQPEGTTQQLSDFDRVFIQLDTPLGQARLGDVDLSLQDSEFAAFNRKIQGAAVQANVPAFGLFAGGRVNAAGATTRGIFQSLDVTAIEGVQGPYRLRGQQGEEFVIVIAGSERVYLDGILLTRGETNDYVIDYATGELTFTPRRLVTSERRLTVDFEYTTSRFTRTLLVGEGEAGLWRDENDEARARVGVAILREGDAATFGDELGLTEADLDAIAAAGDGRVLVDGAERVAFDPESAFVQYVRRDTLFAGETYSIFTPATATADSVFRVRFSRVPFGTGSYNRVGQAINGILFEWVGPSGGDYIPFRILPKPSLRQMVDVRGVVEPVRGIEVFGEWAGSTNDINSLSNLDGGDDTGQAFLAGVRLKPLPLVLGGRDYGRLSATVRQRQQGQSFAGFDRTRPVEFNRIWNLARTGSSFGTDSLHDVTTEGQVRWEATPRTSVVLEAGRLGLGRNLFTAQRGALELRVTEPALMNGYLPELEYRIDLTTSGDNVNAQNGSFLRQRGVLRKPSLNGRLTPMLGFEQERREQDVSPDSVAFGSFAYQAVRPGLAWESAVLSAETSVEFREEEEPLSGIMRSAASATTLETNLTFRPGSSLTSEARVAYRRKRFTNAFQEAGRQDNESVAIRWTNRASPFRRAIELNTIYEALTERTPLLQETYVLVGPDLGEYVWRDGEGEQRAGEPDGVPQVDEFFPETTPLEGTYSRTFVPSDELFPTIGVQAQLRLRLDPGRLIDRESRSVFSGILRNISTQTTLDVRERSTEPDIKQIYLLNPSFLQQRERRVTAEGDTLAPATLSGRFRIGQDVTLFPSQPRYGVRLSLSHLTSTSRLAAGAETRLVQTARLEGNATLSSRLRARLIGTAERNQTDSESFVSRTFDIMSYGIEPQATLTLGPAFSFTAGLAYTDKTNDVAGDTGASGATVWRVPMDARITVGRKLALTLRGERADVIIQGAGPNGLANYELTEGRGPGISYLWGIVGQYTINSFLRASLFYDGRSPAEAPVIHTVRMQLSAVF